MSICSLTEFTYDGDAGAHHAVSLLYAIVTNGDEGVSDGAREELSIHSDHLEQQEKVLDYYYSNDVKLKELLK